MRILDLFSGIGGFSLGLERAGFETVAFCEIEPYARRILRKHWPTVPIFEDVRTLTARRLIKEGLGPIDLICGGFPCQDISLLGPRTGITGERSGLWSEFARLIREIKPRWLIAENLPALRTNGADEVLTYLARAGYSAWPLVVGAGDVGAPHIRKRVWIIAHADKDVKHRPDSLESIRQRAKYHRLPIATNLRAVGHSINQSKKQSSHSHGNTQIPADSVIRRKGDGISDWLDRLQCLGNAVVPQIPELIGRAILRVESELIASAEAYA